MKKVLITLRNIVIAPFTFCANQFAIYESRQNEKRIANQSQHIADSINVTLRGGSIWVICKGVAIAKCNPADTIDETIFNINNIINNINEYNKELV